MKILDDGDTLIHLDLRASSTGKAHIATLMARCHRTKREKVLTNAVGPTAPSAAAFAKEWIRERGGNDDALEAARELLAED